MADLALSPAPSGLEGAQDYRRIERAIHVAATIATSVPGTIGANRRRSRMVASDATPMTGAHPSNVMSG